MKRNLLSLIFILISFQIAIAQYGTATDFMLTDINGEEHHLYEWLEDGKVAVIDVSATWCGPCWFVHQEHYLKDLHEMYGPDGTDQIRVLFYEGDASTTMADLNGDGPNTLGDWVTDVPYPIVDEEELSLDLSLWAPLGFPTINIVRPSDKEIIADVYDQDLDGMVEAINQIITLGETSSNDNLEEAIQLSVFPNPSSDYVNLSWEVEDNNAKFNIEILNSVGQVVGTQNNLRTGTTFRTADWVAGNYFVKITSSNKVVATTNFVKM